VAFLLPVPFVKLSPGPTFNVIGEDEGTDVIRITGTETYPVTGVLDMTTVYETGGPRGGLTFVDAIGSWLDPSDAVVPQELLFPDDISSDDVAARQAILFDTSQSNAIAAAMRYLDRPVEIAVVANAVYSDTPAEGVIEAKDEIVAVNGTPVSSAQQVVDAVRGEPVGTTFEFTVQREGTEEVLSVTSAENPDVPGSPFIGIGVGELYSAEFPIDFTLEDVGGPSAGLMFAMGIVDRLTPGSLTGGEHIAGTGTIDPDGVVGPIGGIRQKLAGARDAGAVLFLMPADHCAEAAGHIPDGLTVAPVTTLTEAISSVEAFTAGEPVAQCPVDAA
jgi:PDZ domain-containing protein